MGADFKIITTFELNTSSVDVTFENNPDETKAKATIDLFHLFDINKKRETPEFKIGVRGETSVGNGGAVTDAIGRIGAEIHLGPNKIGLSGFTGVNTIATKHNEFYTGVALFNVSYTADNPGDKNPALETMHTMPGAIRQSENAAAIARQDSAANKTDQDQSLYANTFGIFYGDLFQPTQTEVATQTLIEDSEDKEHFVAKLANSEHDIVSTNAADLLDPGENKLAKGWIKPETAVGDRAGDMVIRMLEEITPEATVPVWVQMNIINKTIDHIYRTDHIERYFPASEIKPDFPDPG